MTVPPSDAQPQPAQPERRPVMPQAQPPVAPPPTAPAPTYQQPPPAVPPPGYQAPAGVPPVGAAAVPAAAVPAEPATRVVIDAPRYWAGVAATAVVAALVGIVGVLVFEDVLDIDLVVQDLFGTDDTRWALALSGAVIAVVAGALLHVLTLTTPRPRAFFGWIMALGIVVSALLPLGWTDETDTALATGLVHVLMGIAIWSLLAGVALRTSRTVRETPTA